MRLQFPVIHKSADCLVPILILGMAFMLIARDANGQKYLKKGDAYFNRNLFEEAIPYYLKEKEKGTYRSKLKAIERLADCYRLTGQFFEAEQQYEYLMKRDRRGRNPVHVLNYAKSLKSSAKYEEAAEQFKRYIELVPDDPMGPIHLESCYQAQQWLVEESRHIVKNLDLINTEKSDFSTFIYDQGILFSSDREGSTRKFINLADDVNMVRLDLYYQDLRKEGGQYPESVPMEGINTYWHESTPTFSPDGNEVYFTRTVSGGKDRKTNTVVHSLQVFHCQKGPDGEWSEPVSAFSFNSDDYAVGQPSLSEDGNRIYFISDMPGGQGNTDIYYCYRMEDQTWSRPVNLGETVNTFGHELFPYIHGKDTLYFSSETHPGMGKLDIFMVVRGEEGWQNVTNLKPPVNSIGNDFGICMYPDQSMGFFSSDRFNGKGAEDIYTFTEEKPLKIQLTYNELKIKDYELFDGVSHKVLPEGAEEAVALESVDGYFTYTFQPGTSFTLNSRKDGFRYNAATLTINGGEEPEYLTAEISSSSRPVQISGSVNRRVVLISEGETGKDTVVQPQPVVSAEVLLQCQENLVDHDKTDSRGLFAFVEAVQPGQTYYLLTANADQIPVEQEPEPEELLAEETGQSTEEEAEKMVKEENPEIEDEEVVEVPEEEEVSPDPQMRSVEGTVKDQQSGQPVDGVTMSVLDEGTTLDKTETDHDGNYRLSWEDKGNEYSLFALKRGYFMNEYPLESNESGAMDPVDVRLEPVEKDKPVTLNDIYFDFNRATLRSESLDEIEKLAEFMKMNPGLVVELQAHTDNRGDPASNMELSRQRAESVCKYLILCGIESNRIAPVGYGETVPVIRNATSEEEHQLNRRVAFMITDEIDLDIFFTVQLGAFQKDDGRKRMNRYQRLSGQRKVISFEDSRGLTIYTVGRFSSFREADQVRSEFIGKGIKDAFVAAYRGKYRMSVSKARELTGETSSASLYEQENQSNQ